VAEVGGPRVRVPERLVRDAVATAARSVVGVARLGRGGPLLGRLAARRPVEIAIEGDAVVLRLWVVALEDVSLGSLAERVRHAVAAAVEGQLGLTAREVTIVVDGIAV
jgi:uncharacterized alkaline shock family protein YloU